MLTPYIKDLLYRYNQVIIPGLGTLKSTMVSAKIDKDNNKMCPPSKELTFSNTPKKDKANKLANHIVEKDGMSFDAANNFVKFQIEEWLDKLEKERLKLDGIGTLSMEGRDIKFYTDTSANYLLDSFGLSEIEIKSVDRPEGYVNDTLDSQSLSAKGTTSIHSKRKKRRFLLLNSLVVSIILGIGGLMYYLIEKNNDKLDKVTHLKEIQDKEIEEQIKMSIFQIKTPLKNLTLDITKGTSMSQAEITNSANIENKVRTNEKTSESDEGITDRLNAEEQGEIVETPIKKPEQPVVKEIKPPKQEVAKPKKNQKPSVVDSSKPRVQYFIIAGSYSSLANAQTKVASLKQEGYSSAQTISDKESNLTQVAYGVYPDRAKANKALEKIRVTAPYAWVLSVTN